ncbi:MAG: hypothetical protein PHS07_01435 [Patescibacteria group bacterium]|nr:hypothetical protein [Patescibacteria group bacterium]
MAKQKRTKIPYVVVYGDWTNRIVFRKNGKPVIFRCCTEWKARKMAEKRMGMYLPAEKYWFIPVWEWQKNIKPKEKKLEAPKPSSTPSTSLKERRRKCMAEEPSLFD